MQFGSLKMLVPLQSNFNKNKITEKGGEQNVAV
jgi:hypothetical protein